MTFMQHLQSSLILGTKMSNPEEEHFIKQQCKELFTYISTSQIDNIKYLIEAGIDPEKCEHQHLRALAYSVKNNHYEAVQCLLTYGCDPNDIDCFERRPMDYAIETKNSKIVDLLSRYGGYSTQTGTPPADMGFEVSDIFEAALTGNLHALVHYHQLGASLHEKRANRTSLLHLSVEGNNPKLLVYLLNKGLNIDEADTSGTSALIMAAMDASRLKLLEILIKRNATLNQRNHRHTSALTMAIKRFNIQAAMLLIENGADVNIRDSVDTPLSLTHKAIEQVFDKNMHQALRDLETLLLSKGAHVNTHDDNLQWSPLMLTASHYQDERSIAHLKLLIKLGAKIDQVDKNKRTALMISSSLGRIEALELLIKHGSHIDVFDKFGWTALMLAVYYNQKEVVKLLLSNGADVNLSTKKGLSALKVAVDNERASLIPILKDYGAVIPRE
jgi:ankyrin repeat protein